MGAAVAIPIIAAAVTTAGTVYAANQAKKNQPSMPTPAADPTPKLADKGAFASSQEQAQRQAETAGGTIFAARDKNLVGSDPNGQRKSLLGA
jgi:hypothetical protein